MQSYAEELVSLRTYNRDTVTHDVDEATSSDNVVLRVENDATCPDVNGDRGYWGSKLEFFLAIVGYTVGGGSFWRFPIICRWTTLCVMISGLSSFFNGLVVFTILGFMAKETGLSVQEVATQSGPGLTFVVFPIALSKMPFPQLWSVLFFLMLTTVVFDSINGVYVFQLADWYFSQFALLFGSLFECIAVCWIYGTDRFSRDIALMTGRPVSPLLRCMWSAVIPIFIMITFILMLSRYSPPSYGDGYVYSSGAIAIGIAVGLLPNIGMVGVAIRALLRAKGTFVERFRISTVPDKTWQPNNKEARQIYRMKPYDYPGSFKDKLTLNILGPKSMYDF